MTRFTGWFFGTKYDMEFETEKEFIDWMVEIQMRRSPLAVEIMKKLMEQK